jgi:hypothetical protein
MPEKIASPSACNSSASCFRNGSFPVAVKSM